MSITFFKRYTLLDAFLFVATTTLLIFFVFLNFYNLHNYIFLMADDYIYPAGVSDFLTTGSYHWAGAKPGIILLGAMLGTVTPQKMMFLFSAFSLFSGFGLFLVARYLFEDLYLSMIPVILWFGSPVYIYFAKTHLLIYVAFYILGVLLCFLALEKANWRLYYLGCFMLGFSVLCYYVILPYIAVAFLFLCVLSYKCRYPIYSFVLRTSIPFLLPILLLDSCSVLAYIFWGKKNWPFLYSLWGQFKALTHTVNDFEFLYHLRYFLKIERVFITLLVLFSFFVAVVKRANLFNDNLFKKFLFISLLVPIVVLDFRAYLGHFSAPRAALGVFPIFYLLIPLAIGLLFSKRYFKYFLFGTIMFVAIQIGYHWNGLVTNLETRYDETAKYVQRSDFDVIVYAGPRRLWEQLIVDKEIIPLNVNNDGLWSLKNVEARDRLFERLRTSLSEKKKVALLVTAHFCKEKRQVEPFFEQEFKVLKVVKFSHPYIFSDTVEGMDKDLIGLSLEQKKDKIYGATDIYELL